MTAIVRRDTKNHDVNAKSWVTRLGDE